MGRKPESRIALVFDGGHADQLKAAALLDAHDVPATFLLEPSVAITEIAGWRDLAPRHEIGIHPFYLLADRDGLVVSLAEEAIQGVIDEAVEFARMLGREPRTIAIPMLRPGSSSAIGNLWRDVARRFNEELVGDLSSFAVVRGLDWTRGPSRCVLTRDGSEACRPTEDAVWVIRDDSSGVISLDSVQPFLSLPVVSLADLVG